MKIKFDIEVSFAKAHNPVVSAELESLIERAAYDAVEDHLDPEDLDVNVQES